MFKSVKFEEMIAQWERRLLNEQSIFIKVIKNDEEINKTVLDLKYQRVIKNDCERTRVKDRSTMKNFTEELEKLLTIYCKKNDIQYKQGMNEIMGPFLFLKNILNLSLSRVYNLYSAFIFKFLTNYYHEEEFFSLQSSLALLKLLIKYHEPQISNSLDHGLITPAMYATSWVLTIFANKSKLDVIFHLWNLLIQENDELFVHFLVVGFLRKNKDVIIDSDYSHIPILISTLNINSIEEVNSIFNHAIKIRDSTPHSFRILSNNLSIFQRGEIDQLKFFYDFYHPDKLLVLPLLPSEVIYLAYNNIIECPFDKCEKFTKRLEKLTLSDGSDLKSHKSTFINDFHCYHCKRKKINEDNCFISPKSFVLLDIRIEETSNSGYLPGTVLFDKDDFLDQNFPEKLTERFSFEKDKCHFVLITSETTDFFKFEEKFYKEILDPATRKDTIPTRISKIICENEMNKIKGFEAEKKLNQYDLFKKITKQFIRKNFPYVSFIFGGFKDVHNLKIPLLSHNSNCHLCKRLVKRNSDRRKNSYLTEIKQDQLLKKKEDFRKSMIVPSSNNDDFTLNNKENSHLVLDPNSNNYTLIKTIFSLDNVIDLINNTCIKVFQCYQLDYKNHIVDCKDGTNQVLIFVSKEDIQVLKLDLNENFEESSYILIEKVFTKNILSLNRKNKKNVVKFSFISYLNDTMSMLTEFANDVESKQFIKLVQEYIDA